VCRTYEEDADMIDPRRPLKEQLAEHGITEHDCGDPRKREMRASDGRALGIYTAWRAAEEFDAIVAAAKVPA
jgi:hypothetical protein